MEEKKVCPECENKEHKLEELTQEEADKVAGGTGGFPDTLTCKGCGCSISRDAKYCKVCGTKR